MKKIAKSYLTSQFIIALAVLIGLNSTANAKQTLNNQTLYKAEKCDCIGFFNDDIPTFLSDLKGAQGIDIYGEGKSIKDAEASAQNMCVETYRNFASTSVTNQSESVSHSGCHIFKSTNNEDWVSL